MRGWGRIGLVRRAVCGARRQAVHAEGSHHHALDAAEKQTGRARRTALEALANQVDKDVAGAKDPERVKAMSEAIKDLADETR